MEQTSQQQPAAAATGSHKVPAGLRPLLEAFARETLRAQPTDLIQFGRHFFDTLVQQRERNGLKSVDSLIGDKIHYDIFRNELQQKLKSADRMGCSSGDNGTSIKCSQESPPRPHSPMDIAAIKIQAAFRGHMVRAHPEKFGLDAEVVNGLCQKQKMRRNSNERLALFDNRKDLKRHSVGGYSHAEQISATPEDRAATKIQAEIRGFLTRKHVGQEKKQNQEAATKIQAHIRGYLTRKHLEEQGIVLSPPRSRTSTSVNSLEAAKI